MLKYSENKEGTWKHVKEKNEFFEEIKEGLEEAIEYEIKNNKEKDDAKV